MSAARGPEPSRDALLNSTRATAQRPEARGIAILGAAGLLGRPEDEAACSTIL
jgi:hypothetical protein